MTETVMNLACGVICHNESFLPFSGINFCRIHYFCLHPATRPALSQVKRCLLTTHHLTISLHRRLLPHENLLEPVAAGVLEAGAGGTGARSQPVTYASKKSARNSRVRQIERLMRSSGGITP